MEIPLVEGWYLYCTKNYSCPANGPQDITAGKSAKIVKMRDVPGFRSAGHILLPFILLVLPDYMNVVILMPQVQEKYPI